MATVPCSKCTAERKGFRRELDSWRHKLIHCIGFESILEGIYGPLLLRDLSLFDDYEPEDVIDWSPEENGSHCSFCNLPLEKLNDHVLSSTSPLSSPSDYSPCHVPALSESSQSAHRFLQAVFNKKDVPLDCDPNIPLIAQELMKKMIRQFAMEYASKCLLHTTTNGVQTKTTSPQSETADAPLDLTVSRAQDEKEPQPDGVLDLSNRKSAILPTSKPSVSAINHKGSGRQQRQEYIERSLELSEGLLSKALKDIRSGRLQEQRAALLYGIPLQVLKQGQESWSEEGLLQHLSPGNRDVREEVSSYCVMSSMLGGEARLVLQKVAAWAERAEIGGAAEENGDFSFPSSSLTFFQPNKTIPQSFPQLRDALQPPSSPTPSLEPPAPLRIPQVRSMSDQSRSLPTENGGAAESLHLRTSSTEGTSSVPVLSSAARPLFKLRPSALAHSSNLSPHRLGARSSFMDDMEEGTDRRDKDKQPRKKRGRYRQYDHELMEEAITMVMAGRMSVSKAQGVYGVPHSTLEYKVKERTGTLKNPPKKKSAIPCPSSTNVSRSDSTCSATSGILTSAAPTNSCSLTTTEQEREEPQCPGTKSSALGAVLSSLCPAHQLLLYRILKLAHQHKQFLKSLKQVQPECYRCHYHSTRSDCTTCSCCQHWLIDHCSSRYHPGESKSNCSTHHCALNKCGHETDRDSNSCSAQLCKRDTCTIICPNMVHCHSCQSLASTNINNLVCSFSPADPSQSILGLCSSSICCSQHKTLPCPCHLMRSSLTEDESTNFTENEGDITVLKDQSPSPPPLSPIPDMNKQRDEKPPILLHQIQDEEAEPVGKIRGNANLKKYSVKRQNCRATQSSQNKKTSGTLLQDVVTRFSEKLETIKPSEKDASLHNTHEAEKQQLHCASKCVHLSADAHLTEIITTVLHTGSSSEYNLGELINYHNNKEPQSPNTRSRRRQEMLAAMATPTEDATTRRQTLQIKRDLARLDQSRNKQKRATLKNGESILNQVNEEFEREIETVELNSDTSNKPKTGTVASQVENKQDDDMVVSIKEEADVAVFKETPLSFQGDNWEVANCKTVRNLDKEYKTSNCAKNIQCPLNRSNNSQRARKSKRNIVPPPRYSSYVTEPRKMYFVACFSDTIFNSRSRTDEVITSPQSPGHEPHHENNSSKSTIEYSPKADSQSQAIPTTKNSNCTKNVSDMLMDDKCVAMRRRRLQLEDDKTMPSTCTDHRCLEYTSPIKLMFVSPVKDEKGMKYSLKSAAAVNGSREDECFDPCEESSWSGTPEKITRQNTQLATLSVSPLKSSALPPKLTSVSLRSSPKTSPKSSPKSGSPKSNTSSPKVGTRRLSESTPTKRVPVDDTQRFPHDASSLHENTPPKRRRGRPKKLGPQLEKKVKRPIGRPRKQKVIESNVNEKVNGNTEASDTEKNINKNLKITVLYGRSRRNKRMVSEGFDQLQTEFHDACQAVGLNKNWSMLMKTTKVNSALKTASVELSQKIPLIRPVKDCAPHSKSIIKCPTDDAAPSRKPGRPAKVKISGISVTVTTVSPRQRKIQINKDKASPIKQNHKRALFQKPVSAKEHKTITCHSVSKRSDEEQHSQEPKGESEAEPNPPVAVRHSERVRKPSIHFLHAVATSSSYSRSSALVRRSKQLLLNKTKKDESHKIMPPSGEKQHLREEGKGKASSLGLQQIATVSVDSVYRPKEMNWWSTSVQEKTLKQEFARRIRLISDTWVSDTWSNETGFGSDKCSTPSNRKPKCSSVVRSLFDCSPNKPRSCSMQQLCSWFMQTTETQSLSIVKKASSRNPYEVMHFPRNTCKKTTCYSPQAERLRKHLKKFAKSVPKTPNDYAQAQKKIHRRNNVSKPTFKKWHSTTISATGRLNYTAKERSKSFSKYKACVYRAKRRFLTRKDRKTRMKNKTQHILNRHATGLHPKQKALLKSATKHFSFSGQRLDPVHVLEEHLCSEHSSPETMKECRVFLRKIYSPNNGAAKEEGGSRTVTLDEGSPSELLLRRSEKDAGINQAVKTEHIRSPKSGCFRDSESRSPDSVQGEHVEPMRGRSHRDEVLSASPQPPPAKRLRQSRMTGLSGPRWRDFVFEN